MRKPLIASLVLAAAMLSAVAASQALTPRFSLSDQRSKINLEQLIPTNFGEWRLEPAASAMVVNPEVAAELSEIYSQTLMRTYVNGRGDRVMLSIAYGDNQSRQLQVHRPEVCYSAQGFTVGAMDKTALATAHGNIPVMQLVARQGPRIEPITYWVLIGETVVRGNIEQGLARLRYGLHGTIADGLLFRVSTIGDDTAGAYATQHSFVSQLMAALPAGQRERLIGQIHA